MNAVDAIRARYPHRIGQVDSIINNPIRATERLRYSGIFVLDYFAGSVL